MENFTFKSNKEIPQFTQIIHNLSKFSTDEDSKKNSEEIKRQIADINRLSNEFVSKSKEPIKSGVAANYNRDIYLLDIAYDLSPEQIILSIVNNAQKLTQSVEDIINETMKDINNTQNKISSTEVNILSKARADRPEKHDEKVTPDTTILNWIKENLGEKIFTSYNKKIPQEKYDQMILSIRGWIDDQNAQINMNMTYLRKFITDNNQTIEYSNAIISRFIKANLAIINSFKN